MYGIKLVRRQAARGAVDYPQLKDDTVWDYRALGFFGLLAFICGAVAGLIGIAAAMVRELFLDCSSFV